MNKIDVEKEFGRCIQQIGGQSIRELLGHEPPFKNADYLFDTDGVVGELKCLAEDKGINRSTIEKVSKRYEAVLESGKAPVVGWGTVKMTTKGFPDEFTREILEIYRGPIHEQMKKANHQIRETKKELGRPEHKGLVLLANDGHAFLDPSHLRWLVNDTMLRYSFSSINTVVAFTVNLPARHARLGREFCVWMPISRSDETSCGEAFLTKLSDAWIGHVRTLTGQPIPRVDVPDEQFLYELDNLPQRRNQ